MSREVPEEMEHHTDDRAQLPDADARRFQETLLDLSLLNRDDLLTVFATIAEAGANALSVERVSLWQYDKERSVMLCPAAWVRGEIIEETLVISRDTYPQYWGALHADRTLVVSDAVQNQAMSEIQDRYILKHGIGAMLDSSVRVERATFGIVCMEHLEGTRVWTPIEEQFVASLADRMGLAILVDAQRRLESQLTQAQKMEALGLMAGGVAHDFNNMLNIVLTSVGSARAMVDRGADPSEDLIAIEAAVQRAAALTRKLLYISRNETLGREVFDLNDAIRQLADVAHRMLPPSVRLQLLPATHPLMADAERTFVDQALMNLCINAMHAMPDGGSLTVAGRRVESDGVRRTHGVILPAGTYAHLRVLDTGTGIAPGALSRVFDPFYSTKGKTGTGLGLSVVYGGMRQHGGFVSLESVVGRGTVFHLFFRIAQ